MEEVRKVADQRQQEADEEANLISERLHTAKQVKLTVLEHAISAFLVDIEGLETFIRQCIGTAAMPQPGVTASEFAQLLIDRLPELTGRASRLLSRPVVLPEHIGTEDLPQEGLEVRKRRERFAALEQLVRVKDELAKGLVEQARDGKKVQAEQQAYTQRLHAFAEAAQAASERELKQWASAVDEYSERLEEVYVEADAARQEATALRDQNMQLREQNELLRAHCEELRQMVVGGMPPPPMPMPPPSFQQQPPALEPPPQQPEPTEP